MLNLKGPILLDFKWLAHYCCSAFEIRCSCLVAAFAHFSYPVRSWGHWWLGSAAIEWHALGLGWLNLGVLGTWIDGVRRHLRWVRELKTRAWFFASVTTIQLCLIIITNCLLTFFFIPPPHPTLESPKWLLQIIKYSPPRNSSSDYVPGSVKNSS